MALIRKDATIIAAVPLSEAEDWLAAQEIARDEVTVEAVAAETKALARQMIAQAAGDTETVLGTYGDAVSFLLVEVAALASAIAEARSVTQIKAAAAPLSAALAPLAAAVEDGSVALAYRRKAGGEAAQLAEIDARIGQVGRAFGEARE